MAQRLNIPNSLTVFRILLTPLFVILLFKGQERLSLLVFALAGISDGLDGFIARCFNQRTALGAFLDPVADKLLLTSAFVSLAIMGILPFWLAVIVICRDVIIVIGIISFFFTGKPIIIRPSRVSKVTTFVQLATVFISLLNYHVAGFEILRHFFIWSTTLLTILSGLHYLYTGILIFQDNRKGEDLKKKI